MGQISCGQDLTVWLTLTGKLYAFDVVAQKFVEIEGPPSALSQASVSTLKQAFAVDDAHNLSRYTMNLSTWNWQPLRVAGLPPVKQVATVDPSHIYALDTSSKVWAATADDGAWAAEQLQGQFISIDAAEDGAVWGLDTGGAALELADGAWLPRSEEPQLVSVAVAAANQVVALDRRGAAWQWSADRSLWCRVEPPATEAIASISVAQGQPLWAVTSEGRLVVGPGAWAPTGADRLKAVSAGPAGELWGIDVGGTALEMIPPGGLPEGRVNRPEPVPQRVQPHWDAASVYNDNASTHLWIVNNAARLVAQAPLGEQIYHLVEPDTRGRSAINEFHNQLCWGLYDADDKSPYKDQLFASHFYDPDTQKNYMGQLVPTALTQGGLFFRASLQAYAQGRFGDAGYNLGLSLHYLTDLTQPMHAANFTNLNSPALQHSLYETWVMEVQKQFPPPQHYEESSLNLVPEDYLIAAAKSSKLSWPAIVAGPNMSFNLSRTREVLTNAITITAQYLVAWRRSITSSVPKSTTGLANLTDPQRVFTSVPTATFMCCHTLVHGSTVR